MKLYRILILWVCLGTFLMFLSVGCENNTREKEPSNVVVETARPLPIPPLLEDLDPSEGEGHFKLVAQKGTQNFYDHVETPTMGYNGNYLGPAIKVKSGDHVTIDVTNQLGEKTSVHWHGLIVNGEADGGPHQMIEPNTDWTAKFTIKQPAATLWFHPHVMGLTATQVYNGLAGLLIVEDDISKALSIPNTYGVDDIPLVIQDRLFDTEGAFIDPFVANESGVFLVNGALTPYLDVEPTKIRLRVLNGANANSFNLIFDKGDSFKQIASDGGFLETPIAIENLFLAPGERAEIVLDFADHHSGDEIALTSEGKLVMTFRVGGTKKTERSLPTHLTTIERMSVVADMPVKEIVVNGMGHMVSINGRQFDMSRIDDTATVGVTEQWVVTNTGGMMHAMGHPFHIHSVQFQILSRSKSPLKDTEKGWKDTVYIEPNETVTLLVQFKEKGVFMYHCHILEHEEAGMMAQIKVQ